MVGGERFEGLRGEQNRTVPIGFEVDTDIIVLRGVMKVFDTRGDALDWKTLWE